MNLHTSNSNHSSTTTAEDGRHNVSETPRSSHVNVSAGACHFGIRGYVRIESRILEDYCELDETLGLNTAGVILTLLADHLGRVRRVQRQRETITAILFRRSTGAMVSVVLDVRRCLMPTGQDFIVLLLDHESGEDDNSASNGQTRASKGPLERWQFRLTDDAPGPCVADAIDHIEKLGLDPQCFRVKMLSEKQESGRVTCEFLVEGRRDAMEKLRQAHECDS